MAREAAHEARTDGVSGLKTLERGDATAMGRYRRAVNYLSARRSISARILAGRTAAFRASEGPAVGLLGINNLLTEKGYIYRIYLPPDANTLLVTMERCLQATDSINLLISGKQPMPQWLTYDEVLDHCRVGASIWRWASTNQGEDPEILFACSGGL